MLTAGKQVHCFLYHKNSCIAEAMNCGLRAAKANTKATKGTEQLSCPKVPNGKLLAIVELVGEM